MRSEGPLTLTATLSRRLPYAVVAQWRTIDGTALAGTDFVGSSGQIVIDAGELTASVSVTLIDYDEAPAAEFEVEIYSITGARLNTDATAEVALEAAALDSLSTLFTEFSTGSGFPDGWDWNMATPANPAYDNVEVVARPMNTASRYAPCWVHRSIDYKGIKINWKNTAAYQSHWIGMRTSTLTIPVTGLNFSTGFQFQLMLAPGVGANTLSGFGIFNNTNNVRMMFGINGEVYYNPRGTDVMVNANAPAQVEQWQKIQFIWNPTSGVATRKCYRGMDGGDWALQYTQNSTMSGIAGYNDSNPVNQFVVGTTHAVSTTTASTLLCGLFIGDLTMTPPNW